MFIATPPSSRGETQPFRNEVVDSVRTSLSLDWFMTLPRRGNVRLDIVSTLRPRLSVHTLSDVRFEALKSVLGVGREMEQVVTETPELLR